MLTPDITNPFHSVLFRGVEEVAIAHGYDTVLCNTDDNPERCRNWSRCWPKGISTD